MGEVGAVIAGLVGAILFVEVCLRLDLIARTGALLAVYRQSWHVVRSARISDHWKEKVLPRYAGRMLARAARVTLILAAALAVLVAAAYAVALAGATPEAGGVMLVGWPFNLAAIAGGSVYALLRKLVLR